jgi:sulfoxide reductase heme-binding subunit YedZ
LGQTGLKLLVIGLAITPLRRFAGINLIRFRRAIGVTAFTYIVVHLSVWLVLDLQSFARIWSDILKRPYITIGMVAFTLMIPLAVTSNNLSLRKLGVLWRRLHKLTYVIVVLGGIHFVMVRKGIQLEPLIYLGVILVLLTMRIKWRKPQGRLVRQRDTA